MSKKYRLKEKYRNVNDILLIKGKRVIDLFEEVKGNDT